MVVRFKDAYAGTKRTKIRYGPYRLPSIKEKSLLSQISGEQGTMTGFNFAMKKPCVECSLLVAQTSLEYTNGTEATLENGSWLHHIVLYTAGDNHKDAVCPRMPGERTFSVGNEKSITTFGDVLNKRTIKSGFPVTANDRFLMQLELMNISLVRIQSNGK
jgi:hypothetical protein